MTILRLAQEALIDYKMQLDTLEEKASRRARAAPEAVAINQDLRMIAYKVKSLESLIQKIIAGEIRNYELD